MLLLLCAYSGETDWTKEVWYHENLAGRLEEAISGIQPQSIYMGWHTDSYQPCEKEYCQTRQVLELLQSKGYPDGILTKSDLILRDMDLLQKMDQASVSVSVAFKDNTVRQLFEADTVDKQFQRRGV
jgi:DNA repair photolyase